MLRLNFYPVSPISPMTAYGRAGVGIMVLIVAGCGGKDADGTARDTAPASSSGDVVGGIPLVDITARAGLDVSLARAQDGRYFMPDSMTGGCALLDADGDGDLDIFLAHGRWVDGAPAPDGLGRLFLRGDDGRYGDVSHDSGVVAPYYGMGVAVGDVDADGDVDLYVSCYGTDRLLLNDGAGKFTDTTESAGLGQADWGTSCCFFDYDADGLLDLFVANYVDFPPDEESRDRRGDPEYPAPGNYQGQPDRLYRGVGDGTFHDVSREVGIAEAQGRGLGVAAGDWNGDGRVDIYVANDGEANHCWIQQADGRFQENAFAMGLAVSGSGRAEAGMGIAHGDVDGDGREDLVVTHLVQETHTYYRSGENGLFRDSTLASGLARPSINMTGFGAVLADVDLDGALELVLAHGRVLRGPEVSGASGATRWRSYAEPNAILRAEGGRFAGVSAGEFDRAVEASRGLALGDIDADGDLDVLVTNAGGTVRLYETRGAPAGGWLAVRAMDPSLGGRDVYGAKISLQVGDLTQSRIVQPAHGYLSSSEPAVRFGLGGPPPGDGARIEVNWPDGTRERFEGPWNTVLTAYYGKGDLLER